jgi:hypothetical protein
MNELIKELLVQCQVEKYGINGELLEIGVDAEKFAQLIVRECTNIVLHFTDVDEGVAVAKKHFGVEE